MPITNNAAPVITFPLLDWFGISIMVDILEAIKSMPRANIATPNAIRYLAKVKEQLLLILRFRISMDVNNYTHRYVCVGTCWKYRTFNFLVPHKTCEFHIELLKVLFVYEVSA